MNIETPTKTNHWTRNNEKTFCVHASGTNDLMAPRYLHISAVSNLFNVSVFIDI